MRALERYVIYFSKFKYMNPYADTLQGCTLYSVYSSRAAPFCVFLGWHIQTEPISPLGYISVRIGVFD